MKKRYTVWMKGDEKIVLTKRQKRCFFAICASIILIWLSSFSSLSGNTGLLFWLLGMILLFYGIIAFIICLFEESKRPYQLPIEIVEESEGERAFQEKSYPDAYTKSYPSEICYNEEAAEYSGYNQTGRVKNSPLKGQKNFTIRNLSDLDSDTMHRLKKQYISIDLETTGLNAQTDRIIEIGIALFQNGEETERYDTLIDPGILIPAKATAINHITNDMIAAAPRECIVCPVIAERLKDVLKGEIIVCAHNAPFDISFLAELLSRYGYSGNIDFVDTLAISRRLLDNMRGYKLVLVAEKLGVALKHAHRAMDDAEACGKILWELLDCEEAKRMEEERMVLERERMFEESRPTEEEWEVCAYIQKTLAENGEAVEHIRFGKDSKGYVHVYYLSTLLKFKFSKKKGKYIIVPKKSLAENTEETESCPKSEGGEENVRFFFKTPFDLEKISPYILEAYERVRESIITSFCIGALSEKTVKVLLKEYHPLSLRDMEKYLEAAQKKE